MFKIDWWHPEEKAKKKYEAKDCGFALSFYPNDGEYRGNLYYDGRCVADIICNDSVELDEIWPGIWEGRYE